MTGLSDRDRAALVATRAALAAGMATIDAIITRESGAPATSTVTLEEHMRRTGQNKRKAREAFAAFEREGFVVVRLGRAAHMDAAEWARAIDALASRRAKRHAREAIPANATEANTADALLDAVGARPVQPSTHRGQRQKRAA